MMRKLQYVSQTSKVLRSWTLHSSLAKVTKIFEGIAALILSHIRRNGNKLEKKLSNEGLNFRIDTLDLSWTKDIPRPLRSIF